MSARKCVAFQAQACLETVFTADEWDRTPTEPSRKLSYQDLLELKEIQRSLPIADQPPDPLAGRAGRRYLSGVPIALVPLLPESDSQQPPTSPVQTSPNPTSPWMAFSPNSRQSSLVPTPPYVRGAQAPVHQPHLAHLPPSQQQAPKPKPRFAFLPLLDSPPGAPTPGFNRSRTPSPARSDPPTPALTNTSLDSSPMSQASTSSSSSEPPFFQLPPPKNRFTGYCQDEDSEFFPHSLTSAMQSMKVQPKQTIGTVPKSPFPFEPNQPTWFGRSNPAFKPAYTVSTPPPAPSKPEKKRNVIVVNGIEIDLDGDDTPAPAPKPKKKRNPEISLIPLVDHLERSPHTPAFDFPISYPLSADSATAHGRIPVLRFACANPVQEGRAGPPAIISPKDPAAVEFFFSASWFVLRCAEYQTAVGRPAFESHFGS
ncbi:hypothetical protein MD484_g3323, partial [Candolleomyces efflorescens]